MNTIVYQGLEGCYSHLVAKHVFPLNPLIGLKTFEETFKKLDQKQAKYCILPIENSLAGSVIENYKWLHKYRINIIAEFYKKIEHCLLALPHPEMEASSQLQMIKQVLSHPKALEQCLLFFQQHPSIEPVVFYDTAGAAAFIKESKKTELGAIASSEAAQIYGLNVLQHHLEDNIQNYTRFLLITSDLEERKFNLDEVNKCSFKISLKNNPQSLIQVLQIFANKSFSLTKIESIPLQTNPFKYIFYFDFSFIPNTLNLREVLKDLKNITDEIEMLGLYKSGEVI